MVSMAEPYNESADVSTLSSFSPATVPICVTSVISLEASICGYQVEKQPMHNSSILDDLLLVRQPLKEG